MEEREREREREKASSSRSSLIEAEQKEKKKAPPAICPASTRHLFPAAEGPSFTPTLGCVTHQDKIS